jgi:hypothetical protein
MWVVRHWNPPSVAAMAFDVAAALRRPRHGIIDVEVRREAYSTANDVERRVEDILRPAAGGSDMPTPNHVGDGLDRGCRNGGIHRAAPACLGQRRKGGEFY